MTRVTRHPDPGVIPAHADAGRVGYELARTPEPKEGVDERREEQAGTPGG